MVADIMETLYTRPEIQDYVIVSGDGGFVSVVVKLKELGKKVSIVSVGDRLSTLLSFYCDEVYPVEVVESPEEEETTVKPKAGQKAMSIFNSILNKVIKQSISNGKLDLNEKMVAFLEIGKETKRIFKDGTPYVLIYAKSAQDRSLTRVNPQGNKIK
jgi:hypothetical protein